jgi:hypothetical protein
VALITVTGTQTGSGAANGSLLDVLVVTGQGGSLIGASNSSGSVTTPQLAIASPIGTNSLVVGVLSESTSTAFTILASSVAQSNNANATNSVTQSGFTAAAGTTAGVSTGNLGASAPTNTAGLIDIALLEIIAGGAGVPAIDGSTPAPVATTTLTATTAQFNPPPGSLLVARFAGNSTGSGTTAATMTDSSGLVWTQRIAVTTSNTAYAGIWTAQIPSAAPVQQQPGGQTWRRKFRRRQVPVPPLPGGPAFTAAAGIAAGAELASTGAKGANDAAGIVAAAELQSTGIKHAFGSSNITAGAGGASSGAKNAAGASAISAGAEMAPVGGLPGLTIVNQWILGADTTGYGGQYARVSNTAGNGLIAILACGVNNPNVLPRFTIADDAHNWWVFCGTETVVVAGANRRVDVWCAPNARAASVVMAGESWIFSGMTGGIYEVAGFPTYCAVDFVAVTSGSGTSASPSGTATVADYAFGAVVLSGSNSNAAITGPAGWTALTAYNTGTAYGDMRDEYLTPAYKAVSAGAVAPSWSWTGTADYMAIAVGFQQSPAAPVQVNPNWPALKVEAAFGYSPGQTGIVTAYPSWTDLTSYVVDDEGNSEMKFGRGRAYELTQPEAGTGQLNLLNNTGAFNPMNAASPFYPNVLPEVPVRASAFWNGRQYGIGYVYASKWPQDFPDPQWGMTNFRGTDAISIASNIKLQSAYAGEVLADQPSVYLPLGEYYNSANGQPFANLSRVNQKPAYGVDDGGIPLMTDLGTALPGDPATGVGTTAFTIGVNAGIGACGAYYRDANLSSLAAGFTMECWASASPGSTNEELTLLSVMGAPSNYNNSGGGYPSIGDGMRFHIELFTRPTTILAAASLNGYATSVTGITTSTSTSVADVPQGSMHHYVATCINNGGTWTIKLYCDGGLSAASNTGTSVPSSIDAYMLAIGPVVLSGGSRAWCNYVIRQVAIYPTVLPIERITAHYQTMISAASGDLVNTRVAKLLDWAGSGVPGVATYPSPSPAIGNADQIQGQAITDALYALSVEEGGMYYCPADSQGEILYASRTSLYNKAPKYVFGDNPGLGEVPYLPGSGFDYDDQFLFNIVRSQRTASSSTAVFVSGGQAELGQYSSFGASAVTADQTSEGEFFPRGPLEQDGETTSDQDAYDRANWSLVKYKQPHLRANQIQLDPASNPSIWATALAVEQGDVVTVNRRPIGGAVISLNCMVQQVTHTIGPSYWRVTLSLSPYFPENAVIQLDNGAWNTPGSGALGW